MPEEVKIGKKNICHYSAVSLLNEAAFSITRIQRFARWNTSLQIA